MRNEIVFYQKESGESPVETFVKTLPVKHRAKVYWELTLLEQYGKDLKEPYVKHLAGEEFRGLWELRIRLGSDISRIVYFTPAGNRFVLLHGFIKKTQKAPKIELAIAKKRMKDYQRRYCL
jgi:phage-related protein